MTRVELSQWHQSVAEVSDEGFGMLIAVDLYPQEWCELWFRTAAGTTLSIRIARDGSEIAPSLADLGNEYAWKEQEIHEMFGITFDNPTSNQPRLLADTYGSHPLRRDVLLKARNQTVWPGAKDPSDTSSSPSRRKSLPLGVSAEPGELV